MPTRLVEARGKQSLCMGPQCITGRAPLHTSMSELCARNAMPGLPERKLSDANSWSCHAGGRRRSVETGNDDRRHLRESYGAR
jgi:hypothetical protein